MTALPRAAPVWRRAMACAARAALAIAVLVLPMGCAERPPAIPANELRAQASGGELQRLYELNGWRPLWTERRAAKLSSIVDDAPRHGLSADAYRPPDPDASPAERELALSRLALAYARALAHGAVDPTSVHGIFGLRRNDVDLAAGLRTALVEGDLADWFAALPPQDAAYRALSDAYMRERAAVAEGAEADAALNAVRRDRMRQLAVNLERRRWLNRSPPATRIDVDVAAARLAYVRDGQLQHVARVVAGAPDSPTPQLEESFSQLVANPPWHVPDSIAEAEILPRGAGYMASRGMYMEDGRVIQRAGPGSALGRVKFDMQNRHAIYLHDTPAKELFARDDRHLSHGCVRVDGAVAFARLLAAERDGLADLDRRLASGETGVVRLGGEIPVRLLYHTATVENGAVVLRPDVYGWDDRLARRLGLGGPEAPPQRATVTTLFGP